jgi:hypothetical protein
MALPFAFLTTPVDVNMLVMMDVLLVGDGDLLA